MFNIETSVVDSIANSLSDREILAISALLFGLLGGLMAFLANRFWFHYWPTHGAYDDKLGEAAHTSMLGFSAFVLALLITNGLSTLSETDKAVRAEATTVYRLGQELDALGPSASTAKQALASYAHNVGEDEWPRLATLPVSLSPLVQRNLDDLWMAVRSVQEKLAETAPSRSDYRADLSKYMSQIETSRSGRLSAATLNIPDDFWIILLLFVLAASVLSGRETAKRFGIQINMMHMSAIGLAVGLVIVLDNPFRGETSIGPEIIEHALTP
jgi:ABC-type Fe3+-siderophore transport system permease subunit